MTGVCPAADFCVPGSGLCAPAVCGDGNKDGLEECDDGAANSDTTPNACRTNCKLPHCGDGVTDTNFGESCDDGNTNNDDGCTNECKSQLCGNGNIDGTEQCDNGPLNSDTTPNACRTNCVNAFCGDGVTDTGEQCDNGAQNSDTTPDACRTNCQTARCGDGVTDTAEQCDDGNTTSGDGCSATCQIEQTVCGDGIIQAPETCDDGNTTSGDGCSSTCQVEQGQTCFGTPSVCCPSGNIVTVNNGNGIALTNAIANIPDHGCVFVTGGTYPAPSTFTKNATLVGTGGATIAANGSSNAISTGTETVVVEGFTLSASNGDAVKVASGGTVRLRRVNFTGSSRSCVNASSSSNVTILESTLTGCGSGGVLVSGTSGGSCDIESSFIVKNGGAGATHAGVELSRACTFVHNTVAGNRNDGQNANADGVTCATGTVVSASIIFGNSGAGRELDSSCSTSNDDFENATGANGNISLDPQFVSSTDFHIQTTSPCIDKITPSLGGFDIDGQQRPLGAGDDIGADEVR